LPLGALPHYNEIAVDEFPKKMAVDNGNTYATI
jgi:hypothetical protein